jgi:hypothetical protein
MINKLLVLAILPLLNTIPVSAEATTPSLSDIQATVHELRLDLTLGREKLKNQLNSISESDMEKLKEDMEFFQSTCLYIDLEHILELDLMFLENAAAKYAK